MNQSVLKHITSDGERWDSIAHRYYGQAGMMGLLIDANPHLPITEVFTAGQTVFVPIIKQPTNKSRLPPWMQ
ncbi:tail protein X [Moraxella nasibovis]|uniref:tail protein X n=1 Tax=Moraxella nasibovis TaxID=2904120 RepID=UPI0024106F58|nr:tail protein X [Moraxella nasibovis]WFF39598.1 tail protein X [Moraxella nasibovis]